MCQKWPELAELAPIWSNWRQKRSKSPNIGRNRPKIGRKHSKMVEVCPNLFYIGPNQPKSPRVPRIRPKVGQNRTKQVPPPKCAEVDAKLGRPTQSLTGQNLRRVPPKIMTGRLFSRRRAERRKCKSGAAGNLPPTCAIEPGAALQSRRPAEQVIQVMSNHRGACDEAGDLGTVWLQRSNKSSMSRMRLKRGSWRDPSG